MSCSRARLPGDREMAVRMAIGAGRRGRLVRQLLTETLLLFMLGGLAGLVLARGMTSLLVSRLPTLPVSGVARAHARLARDRALHGGTLARSRLCCPDWRPRSTASKPDVLSGLRDAAPRVGRLRLRHAFVIGQVAFSIAPGQSPAGLFARALHRAASVDPGFDAHGVELTSIDLTQGGYTDKTGPAFRSRAGRIASACCRACRRRRSPGVCPADSRSGGKR